MMRHAFAAAALLAAAPLAAQSTTQDDISARYDRALAAGYKALFLCSAIANAERNGTTRTPESVAAWELTGIQSPLDAVVHDLPYTIDRDSDGEIRQVVVEWAGDMPPRIAVHDSRRGCSQLPIGGAPHPIRTKRPRINVEHGDPVVPVGALSASVEQAFGETHGNGTRTTAVLVQRGGAVLGERYAPGFGPAVPQRTWSVAKSIAATLVGAAVLEGHAQVGRSAGLGSAPNDRRRTITIDHLLRMASGRYSDTAGNRTDPLYYGGSSVAETALHWPLIHAPGSVFRYANNDTLAAVEAVEPSFETQSPAEFFARLGITIPLPKPTGAGITSSRARSGRPRATSRGSASSTSTMVCWLRVSASCLKGGWNMLLRLLARSPMAPSAMVPASGCSTTRPAFLPMPLPPWAIAGNICDRTSLDLVIVRRGEDPAGHRFDIAGFARDVIASLEE